MEFNDLFKILQYFCLGEQTLCSYLESRDSNQIGLLSRAIPPSPIEKGAALTALPL